jgi:two-component system phosphate regulon response regulator OmpR
VSAASAAALPDDAPHLLVVDDDSRIRVLLKRFLAENGYRVTIAEDGRDARMKLAGLAFDLLVLDVMMPGESGLELALSLRASSDVPILMLTARADADDRIRGLEIGADDYLAKPFEPRELLLRIANVLKRRAPPATAPTEIRFGPFTFHRERMQLSRAGEMVRLTDRERRLMRQFAEAVGETIPRHHLVEPDGDGGVGERTVDVQINRLRRKIEPDPANPVYLLTVRGIGYRLVAG